MRHFFAFEPLLIERLNGLQTVIDVLSREDMARINEAELPTPSLLVTYGGTKAPAVDSKSMPHQAHVEQLWRVVVVISNYADPGSGEEKRAEAGPIITEIDRCLIGWRPKAEPFWPLTPESAPAPFYHQQFGYYPLVYSTRIYRKGAIK